MKPEPGAFRATLEAPNVVLLWSEGHVSASNLDLVRAILAKVPEHQSFHVFCDTDKSNTYDTEWRKGLIELFKKYRDAKRLISVQFSIAPGPKGAIIRMGMSAANLFLGGILTAHKTRAEFETALRRAKVNTL